MEPRNDLASVIGDRNTALARAYPTSALEDAAFIDVLARAVDHDLATPDHAPATERAYAHDWADFIAFGDRHSLATLLAAPQTLALT